jgi:hypothetical protein
MKTAMVLFFFLLGNLAARGQERPTLTISVEPTLVGPSFTTSVGGSVVLTCSGRWPALKDCKIADGHTLDEVIALYEKQIDDEHRERRDLVHYGDVCARWGRWHYRKGSETHTKNGGAYTAPDRWRVCLCHKPIYQEEIVSEKLR